MINFKSLSEEVFFLTRILLNKSEFELSNLELDGPRS